MEIVVVPVLSDNYVFLLHDSGTTAVVDPGEAGPVLAAARLRGWTIDQILNTHWHPDHTGGNLAIKAATGATITGPAGEAAKIPGIDRTVAGGDAIRVGGQEGRVIDVPGHTVGHIAFYFGRSQTLFSGDSLFALGCGRLFEGTPAEMHASLQELMALPDATALWFAHEYTQGNARFALTIEPSNAALVARAAEIDAMRAAGKATVPSTLGLERATNPFVRARDIAEFAARRAAKDSFKG